MRCPACTTELRLCSARKTARQTQVNRVYACPSCGATVDTEEKITRHVPAAESPPGVPARRVPKRQQFFDDQPSDHAPLDVLPYKGE